MKRILLLLCAVILGNSLHAQPTFSTYYKDSTYVFDDTFKLLKSDIFTTYKSQFGLTDDDEMVLDNEAYLKPDSANTIDHGSVVSRYKQYYKGFLVEGKSMNVVSKCGIVWMANGSVLQGIDMDTSGRISDSTALDSAKHFVNAHFGYAWQDSLYEAGLKELKQDSTATHYPVGQLVIGKKYGGYADSMQYYALCWRFIISYKDTLTVSYDSSGTTVTRLDSIYRQIWVYVDAKTGAIHTSNIPGFDDFFTTGDLWTWYDGQHFDFETRTCTFCTNHTLADHRKLFTYKQDIYHIIKDNNGNHWNSNTTKTAASAQWNVSKAFDYFLVKHGRAESNNVNIETDMSEFYAYPNSNAAWVPSDYQNGVDEMIKLRPDTYGPSLSAAALDVLCHEFTHAKNYRAANIGWDKGQHESYALNEGFADIFGMLAERYARNSMDWTFGENLGYKRNFFDPWNDYTNGPVADPHTSFYGDALWLAPTYTPYNWSGVLRRWFNSLSQGQSYFTPPYSGIGIETSDQLTYITFTWWLWQNADFHFTRNASLNVATVHFGGVCGPVWKAVDRAWADVGLYGNLLCKSHWLVTGKVLAESQVGNSSDPAVFHVGINRTHGSGYSVIAHNWLLPTGWKGHYNTDSSSFYLDSVPNYDSKPVGVVVVYHDSGSIHYDTLSTVIHFSSECNDASTGGGAQPKNAINNSTASVQDGLHVFPNPNNGTFVVAGKYNLADVKARISVTDVSGKVLVEEEAPINNGSLSKTVKLPNDAPTGIYFLRVTSNGKNDVARIIKK